jgi:hypothetical protein
MRPINRGYLLLLGTWSHLRYVHGSVLGHLFIWLVIPTCISRLITLRYLGHFIYRWLILDTLSSHLWYLWMTVFVRLSHLYFLEDRRTSSLFPILTFSNGYLKFNFSNIYESPEGSFEIRDSTSEIQHPRFEIRDSRFDIRDSISKLTNENQVN